MNEHISELNYKKSNNYGQYIAENEIVCEA